MKVTIWPTWMTSTSLLLFRRMFLFSPMASSGCLRQRSMTMADLSQMFETFFYHKSFIHLNLSQTFETFLSSQMFKISWLGADVWNIFNFEKRLRYCQMLQMFETFCLLGSLYSRADIRCFPLWSKVSEREHNTETFNNQALFNSNRTHFGEGKRSQWKVFWPKFANQNNVNGVFGRISFIFWAL